MSDEFYRRGIQYEAQHAHMNADVDFYMQIASEHGGPILELACGTGRVSVPLANGQHQVVGIDIEESMLAIARAKAVPNTKFVRADMRDFDLGRRFQIVILAFNSLGHLYERAHVEQCFRCVKGHMAEDGIFVVAMFNPNLQLLTRDPNAEREISRYDDPESDNEVLVKERATYDKASQILTSTWHYTVGNSEFETKLRLRVFYPQELQALLHYAGFSIRQIYGNFDRAPFDSDSPHQIYIASAS